MLFVKICYKYHNKITNSQFQQKKIVNWLILTKILLKNIQINTLMIK